MRLFPRRSFVFATLLAIPALLTKPIRLLASLRQNGDETFACAINCMDGRFQDAVKNYIIRSCGVSCVDMVTEPGPNKVLADNVDRTIVANIRKRVGISVHHHKSKKVAIAGHAGCAGNPAPKEMQIHQLKEAEKTVEQFGFDVEIILLWVNEKRRVERVH